MHKLLAMQPRRSGSPAQRQRKPSILQDIDVLAFGPPPAGEASAPVPVACINTLWRRQLAAERSLQAPHFATSVALAAKEMACQKELPFLADLGIPVVLFAHGHGLLAARHV